MPSENSIINSLKNKSVAYDWDFVVAYDREKINHLFLQQFIEKTSSEDEYQMIDIPSKHGIEFKDIYIGPPLISFENSSISSSRAIVRRKIISGTIIETDGGQITRWEYITPAHNYAFLINVELENGNGVVSSKLDVSINFKRGTLINIEGINNVPADILEGFREILSSRDNEYVLGSVDGSAGGGDIIPKKFIVRTQPAPGATLRNSENYGDGAVLLFIATNLNPTGGSAPIGDYPYLLADGRSAALLMGSRAFFGSILASHFDSYITDFKSQYIAPDGKNPPELRFTEGYMTSQNIITGTYSSVGVGFSIKTDYQSADSSRNPRTAVMPMNEFFVTVNDNDASATTLVGKFTSSDFQQYFLGNARIFYPDGVHYDTVNNAYPFHRIGQFDSTLSLSNQYVLTFRSVSTLKLDAKPIDNSLLPIISDDPTAKMAQEFTDALNAAEFLTMPDINTFYVQHILFPSDNILTFDRAAIPGDIIMFGDISENLTTLRITPVESMLAAGKSLQLTVTPSTGVTWSINPVNYGTITNTGLYTAPPESDINRPQQVKITARNAAGYRTTALITVVPSAIELDVAALVINQRTALSSYQFQSILVATHYSPDNVVWTLNSDSVLGQGTLSQSGVYTPPDQFDEGYVFATVTAKLPDDSTASCILCLIHEDVVHGFKIEPSYLYALPPGAEATFTTKSKRAKADAWDLYPALGHIDVEETDEGDYKVFTAFYTAPDTIARRKPVFVRVMEQGDDEFASHALIDLTVAP